MRLSWEESGEGAEVDVNVSRVLVDGDFRRASTRVRVLLRVSEPLFRVFDRTSPSFVRVRVSQREMEEEGFRAADLVRQPRPGSRPPCERCASGASPAPSPSFASRATALARSCFARQRLPDPRERAQVSSLRSKELEEEEMAHCLRLSLPSWLLSFPSSCLVTEGSEAGRRWQRRAPLKFSWSTTAGDLEAG